CGNSRKIRGSNAKSDHRVRGNRDRCRDHLGDWRVLVQRIAVFLCRVIPRPGRRELWDTAARAVFDRRVGDDRSYAAVGGAFPGGGSHHVERLRGADYRADSWTCLRGQYYWGDRRSVRERMDSGALLRLARGAGAFGRVEL